MMDNRPRLFIDMDDVVADMNGFVRAFHGCGYNELESKYMWESVKQVPHLFANLSPIVGSKDFVEYLEEKYHKSHYIAFLTSLPFPTGNLITAAQDKRDWIYKHISTTLPVHTVMGGDFKKYYVNSPDDILIDDLQRNITAWKSYNGIGILHTLYEDTLLQLNFIDKQ